MYKHRWNRIWERETFMCWTTVLRSLQIPFWQQEPFKNAEVLLQDRPTAMWVWAKGFLLLSFSLFKGKRFTAVILGKLSTLRNPSTQMSCEGKPLTLCGSFTSELPPSALINIQNDQIIKIFWCKGTLMWSYIRLSAACKKHIMEKMHCLILLWNSLFNYLLL